MTEPTFVLCLLGRVERDSRGVLRAVLYHSGEVSAREQVRPARRRRRRVTDMLHAALDPGESDWRNRFAQLASPNTGAPEVR